MRSQPGGAAYGIVEDYVGHGIGTSMHMEPARAQLRHGRAAAPSCVPGMALADRADGHAGDAGDRATLADDWTVVTQDGPRAATGSTPWRSPPTGPWVLTALDGGPPGSPPSACPARPPPAPDQQGSDLRRCPAIRGSADHDHRINARGPF